MRQLKDAPDCHSVFLSEEDLSTLKGVLSRWANGIHFGYTSASYQDDLTDVETQFLGGWQGKSGWQNFYCRVEASIVPDLTMAVPQEEAHRLGRLMAYILREYGLNYKALEKDGLFKYDYRMLNEIAGRAYERITWNHLKAEAKELEWN